MIFKKYIKIIFYFKDKAILNLSIYTDAHCYLNVKEKLTLNRTLLDSELVKDLLSDGVKRPSIFVAPPSAKWEFFSLHVEHTCTIPF